MQVVQAVIFIPFVPDNPGISNKSRWGILLRAGFPGISEINQEAKRGKGLYGEDTMGRPFQERAKG